MMRGKIVRGLVLSSLSLGLLVGVGSTSNSGNFNDNAFAKSKVVKTNALHTINDLSAKHGIRTIPGTNIKIKTKIHHKTYGNLSAQGVFYATMTNGHTVFTFPYGPYVKHALEQIPGQISITQAENLTNNSGHWRLYYIPGTDPTAKYGNCAPVVKGYKNRADLDYTIMDSFPTTFGDSYWLNESAYLVSYSKKIVLLSKEAQNNANHFNR
ncbi:hypothetical protein FD05_GL000952 [Lentilactobacillus otakiensis DSM 19908 = JCM 15040]|uniref:Uncharacterized protein n=1 Tax=Lentilactobacillus otakiensis DSM 19908 = JCM 15040 TaxID=1423780 RepID=S4NF01_9LACO|nr:hypothetical protein [Lentilactobacillus otakiensis]KRL09964.1 hypothetical protein FD05_GL000952 [Lentilactobacillus otakiensis DSM 19908 = JCM 15040]MBZ3776264.1 hypothetical protein [Lentilactobacillus otakiensis]GAD17559.1 hypothetical protein LOT_2097 [Lentilactobacillus otakiensis DSM 19908 = JCM 15040]